MILVTSDQMRQFDKHTILSRNVPGIVLMEHAGKAVAEVVAQQGPDRVCVLCGKGNNGGDGWIAARWLKRSGVDVVVYSTAQPDNLVGDALIAFQMAQGFGVPFIVATEVADGVDAGREQGLQGDDCQPDGGRNEDACEWGADVPQADVYVDALLGTGTSRPLSGLLKRIVDVVNSRQARVVAVDVPTGVNGTTGEVPGTAIQAETTVSMAVQKLGTAISPGCFYAGEVRVADIGIDIQVGQGGTEALSEAVDEAWARLRWPRRTRNSHKGTFGRVAIAVGGMKGAPVLAGLGAARSGAGLVVLALSDTDYPAFDVPLEFVLRLAVAGTSNLQDCAALVVGPGLGAAPEWTEIVRNWDGVGVLDADALVPVLERGPVGSNWILTPHPKECGRILGWSTEAVQERRAEAAQRLADESGAIVVLKGYHSLIAAPGSPLLVNLSGNEALATAGTGDVLAGVIGGLLAQGMSRREAAAVGTWLHGQAGELAGRRLSTTSVLASDVIADISRAICLHFDN